MTSGIDPAPILDVLAAAGVLRDDDIVYVGGSVADRLATPWSDVDVFIVGSDAAAPGAPGRLIPLPHDNIRIDLERWHLAEVKTLLDRLEASGAAPPEDHRAFMRLLDEDRDFLHSLAIAVPIRNPAALGALRQRIDRPLLARLGGARALMGISNSQTDLIGWLAAGDWQSAAATSQKLVDFAALALLADAGSTHPGGKWINALLRRHFDYQPVPARLLGAAPTLADHYYRLQIRPDSAVALATHVRACTAFCNMAVAWCQARAGGDASIVPEILAVPVAAGATIGPRPVLATAAQIRRDGGSWYLLHVAGAMYEINDLAAAILLLCDGARGAGEIAALLGRATGIDESKITASVAALLDTVEAAGLLETG